MSSDLLTQEGLLSDLRKRKQLENLYKKKMAKVEPVVPDLQEIQNKYIVSDNDFPLLRKQQGETDEEYAARIDELKTNNSEMLEKYYNSNLEVLKNNLKTMIPNNQQLNDFLNIYSNNAQNVIVLNTYWKKFKKAINDNFDSISYNDFITFTDNFLDIIKDEGITDKSNALKDIDIPIKNQVETFTNAAEVIENKKSIPKIETIPEVPYDATLYPELDQFGVPKRIAELRDAQRKIEIQDKARENVGDISKLRNKSYDIAKAKAEKIARVRAEREKIKAERDKMKADIIENLTTQITNDVLEKALLRKELKKKEAKDLDDKTKIVDPSAPTIEDIEPDDIIVDEGTSSSIPAVEKIAEKDSGFVDLPPKEELVLEPTLEEISSKLEDKDSGFVKPGKKDNFSLDEVKELFKNAKTENKNYTNLVGTYKTRYQKKNNDKEKNLEFKEAINNLLDSIDKTSVSEAKRIKSSIQSHLSESDFNRYVIPYVLQYKNSLVDEGYSKDEVNEQTKKIFGFGLSKSNKIVPIQFGRYILNKNKLDNQNILQVLHENSLNQVKFFKSTYISDDFKDLIYYIIEKKNFSQKLYKLLDNSEQDLFNLLIEKSGLKNQLNINLGSSKYSDVKKMYKDLKEQYEIITSEIESGNDSPLLIKELNKTVKELKQVITHLSKVGEISKSNATNMILSL